MAGSSHLTVDEPATQLGRNLTYGLLDNIGRAIVTGRFENQVFPTEAELAKQHGVSRSVTREAVKMLTAKGLLSARPRQGTTVQPTSSWNLFDTDVLRWMLERRLSLDLLRQFNELRVAVEPEAAALAARVAGEDDITRIDDGLRRMQAAERGLDDPLEADIAFHVAVLRASKNPFYIQLRDVVGTALRTSIRFTNRIKGRTADVAEHAKVRDAIASRDASAARVAMRTIIGDVLVLVEDRLPSIDRAAEPPRTAGD
ncbi:FadR/GntR family transcriptional regulator [Novosphingobium resinovorum]|nr:MULTISPECIES: FadR/GntR family transcriptional regulator [Novosphingobium]MBF7013472.1 FadR family transcriptional regulator [Novosphingobium sp. HR1a]WJM25620.1 FadR/GntR family transcriptional regulator [Novosphingobium resinovorum]